MSRIGKRILTIPEGVKVEVVQNVITVTGPKGTSKFEFKKPYVNVIVEGNTLKVERKNDTQLCTSLHGTTNSLINNMIIGVTEGYKKNMEIVGVGYKFNVSGNKLTINAGYSHPVIIEVPEGLKAESASQTELSISGIDKQAVGEFCATVRKVRRPEPYKGKGIKYVGEKIRHKEGKKAA